MATKHYVTILYPGLLFPEERTRPVAARDPDQVLKSLESSAFAFSFFDREEVNAGDEVLRGDPKNRSGLYYLGKEYSAEEVIAEYQGREAYRVLVSNVQVNEYSRMVHCRTGNWRPLLEGDVVIPAEPPATSTVEKQA